MLILPNHPKDQTALRPVVNTDLFVLSVHIKDADLRESSKIIFMKKKFRVANEICDGESIRKYVLHEHAPDGTLTDAIVLDYSHPQLQRTDLRVRDYGPNLGGHTTFFLYSSEEECFEDLDVLWTMAEEFEALAVKSQDLFTALTVLARLRFKGGGYMNARAYTERSREGGNPNIYQKYYQNPVTEF